MTSRPSTIRQSGKTQAQDVAEAESQKNDEVESVHEDVAASIDSPRSKFRALGFSRMKFSWSAEDTRIIESAKREVDDRIQAEFSDAFQLMHDLFIIVRTPRVDPNTGEVLKDRHGWPEWQRTASGGWVEDWSELGHRQREDFLFTLTTRMFAWEQAAADAWGEAMFAKAKWEEVFAQGYANPAAGTVDDRTHHGRTYSADERYFAVFLTLYSRKADAICRTMGLLGQRIKDVLEN